MKMLYVYNRCASRFPLQRLIFTGGIASIFMVFILYIALNHANESRNKMQREKLIKMMDYNVKVEVKEETQLEAVWDDLDDLEEYESFVESGESFPELSEEEMKRLETRMNERRQRVKDICHEFKINEEGDVNAYEFLVNNKYHLIWCNIFKAASTSWMYNFNLMAGYTKKEASESQLPQALARERYPRPSVDELLSASLNSTSMIIVRHPFERLSSAYRDKMQNCPPISMYANLADEIVMNYRIRDDSDSEESMLYPVWPTFEEFVRYVLHEAESGHVLDVHWAPYTPFCTPCNYDFDVIAKFETLEEDQKYLIQKAGLRNIITPQWRNSGGAKTMHRGVSSNDLMLMHYSQLTMYQISQLFELYRNDFLVFDYSVDDYYSIAKDVIPFEIYDYFSSEEDLPFEEDIQNDLIVNDFTALSRKQ